MLVPPYTLTSYTNHPFSQPAPKNPGLIILEHELSDITVDSFIATFPNISSNGWKFASLAKVVNDGRTYQNAEDSDSDDVKADNILVGGASGANSTSSSASASVTATGASTGTGAAASQTSGTTASASNNATTGSASDKKPGSAIGALDSSFVGTYYLVAIGVVSVVFGGLL